MTCFLSLAYANLCHYNGIGLYEIDCHYISGILINEPRYEKPCFADGRNKDTDQLISGLVFATEIVVSILYSRPGRKTRRQVFS